MPSTRYDFKDYSLLIEYSVENGFAVHTDCQVIAHGNSEPLEVHRHADTDDVSFWFIYINREEYLGLEFYYDEVFGCPRIRCEHYNGSELITKPLNHFVRSDVNDFTMYSLVITS